MPPGPYSHHRPCSQHCERKFFWHPLAPPGDDALVLLSNLVNTNALLSQPRIEAVVLHAVLAFLVKEVLHLLLQFRVGDLVAVIPHAFDEEALALGEDGGHRVEEACLERVALEPEARDVAVKTKIQIRVARPDAPRVCAGLELSSSPPDPFDGWISARAGRCRLRRWGCSQTRHRLSSSVHRLPYRLASRGGNPE